MDISADIKVINTMLEKVQTPSIRSAIKDLLARLKKNGAEERISIEQYNKEIEESLARIDAGEFVTHEEVVKQSQIWLNGK